MLARTAGTDVAVEGVETWAYEVPAEATESDGTLTWGSTTAVVVRASAGGAQGLGYTYGAAAIAELVRGELAELARGADAMDVPGTWERMVAAIRNSGRPGICSMAIAAVDAALWDLKARLLDLPLVDLLGAVRSGAPVYGSGGFTSYGTRTLQRRLAEWVESGIPRVKMKVGLGFPEDARRVAAARAAIGPDAGLMVDANGAFDRQEALRAAAAFAESGVDWFEEPVTSDDLQGLRLLRDRSPEGMEIATGEYGYDLPYFRRLLDAGAVDVLQADATRCGGITEFMRVDALCRAWSLPLSAHTAPSLHAHVACAASQLRHVEYFHDHARVEGLLFDGVLDPEEGELRPDRSRPGTGLELKVDDARLFEV